MKNKSKTRKKILIFYSKTGAGHMRAAEAIAAEINLLNKDIKVVLSDGLETRRFGFNIDPHKSYSLLSGRLILLFNLIYLLTNHVISLKVFRKVIKFGINKNLQTIINSENPDLILSTHHFITPSTIGMKLKVPFVIVVTDLGTPHKIWYDNLADKIIIATKHMYPHAVKVAPKNKVKIIGYPLHKKFVNQKTSNNIQNTILVIGGGTGSGNIKKQALKIAHRFPDKKVVVICARNQKLFKILTEKKLPNLEIHGFVDDIEKIMAKSDIIVTKAGPGTIMESISLQKPLILTSWVGIQEKANVDFVVKNGFGLYAPHTFQLKKAVNKIYENYANYISNEQNVYGTQKIAEEVMKMVTK